MVSNQAIQVKIEDTGIQQKLWDKKEETKVMLKSKIQNLNDKFGTIFVNWVLKQL